ncbi:trypsin-like peptidase domain-containing protein [Streptomyces sp. NPDC058157]|uniref:trypsin-like peptidase domain-containing protein n=1 Tax=Streptomyces sp. NPDC058157 TaxID=3346360 RepID=UPI0036EEFC9B
MVAPGLVLTVAHVAAPDGDLERAVDVREADSTGVWHRARIVWEHRELDLVLLRTEGAVIGGDLPPVRWGELVSDDPGSRPVCTVTGFPRA